jgi:hypothetical protein
MLIMYQFSFGTWCCGDTKHHFIFTLFKIDFSREFRHVLTRAEPKRITQEAEEFLKGKGICIQEENHTYIGCMVVKKTPFFSQYLSMIDILWWKFVDNINLGASYLKGNEKGNSLPCLFMLEIQ